MKSTIARLVFAVLASAILYDDDDLPPPMVCDWLADEYECMRYCDCVWCDTERCSKAEDCNGIAPSRNPEHACDLGASEDYADWFATRAANSRRKERSK